MGIWPAGDTAGANGASAAGAPTPDAGTSAADGPPIQPVMADHAMADAAPILDGAPTMDGDPYWLAMDDPAITGGFGAHALPGALAIIGAGWAIFTLWSSTAGFAAMPGAAAWPAIVAAMCAPAIGLMLAYQLVERGSERSVKRHLHLLGALRHEQFAMADRLVAMDKYWREAQSTLEQRASHFLTTTLDASARMDSVSGAVESRMREALLTAGHLTEQGESARRHMEGLVLAMPKVDEVARRAADNMRQAGQSAYQFGGQLEAQIAAIHAEATQAESALVAADHALAERIDMFIAATGTATQQAANAGAAMDRLMQEKRDAALGMLADVASGLDDSATSIEQRIAAAQKRIAGTSEKQAAALATALAKGGERADQIDRQLAAAIESSAALDTQLQQVVAGVARNMADMDSAAQGNIASIAAALVDLQGHIARVASGADEGGRSAALLAEQAAILTVQLSEATREVDLALPQAVEKLQAQVVLSRNSLSAMVPLIAANDSGINAALERLRASETMLDQQVAMLAAID
ncbi:MAG: hypothetical protein ACKOUM_09360, partial [Sphingopyxis sp.]